MHDVQSEYAHVSSDHQVYLCNITYTNIYSTVDEAKSRDHSTKTPIRGIPEAVQVVTIMLSRSECGESLRALYPANTGYFFHLIVLTRGGQLIIINREHPTGFILKTDNDLEDTVRSYDIGKIKYIYKWSNIHGTRLVLVNTKNVMFMEDIFRVLSDSEYNQVDHLFAQSWESVTCISCWMNKLWWCDDSNNLYSYSNQSAEVVEICKHKLEFQVEFIHHRFCVHGQRVYQLGASGSQSPVLLFEVDHKIIDIKKNIVTRMIDILDDNGLIHSYSHENEEYREIIDDNREARFVTIGDDNDASHWIEYADGQVIHSSGTELKLPYQLLNLNEYNRSISQSRIRSANMRLNRKYLTI